MAVDRLSVTVPSDLGAALRGLAEARGETVSTIVTEAIAQRIRSEALATALAEADRRFGPISDELVGQAESEILAATKGKRARKRGRST